MNDWQFEQWSTGTIQGWNHGILANFRDNTLRNLVRETIQNSLDNRCEQNKSTPVQVKFVEHKKNRENIPGINALSSNIEKCILNVRQRGGNDETITGLKHALDHSQRDTIRILEIADYNTTGMKGPRDTGKPFHNYLFTEGDTTKNSTDAGSHGHGKLAPLTNSEMRTIFVSTMWQDGNDIHTLFQGMTLLCSRTCDDGKSLSNKGYWGKSNFMPMKTPPEKFEWMARKEVGTSIFLVGWDSREGWQPIMLGHVISNYFAALKNKKLQVQIGMDGGTPRTKFNVSAEENFEKYFDNEKVITSMKKDSSDSEQLLQNAKFYLQCLGNHKTLSVKETQISPSPGRCELRLILDEHAPKKIAFIRNDMLITDQLPFFWKNPPNSLTEFAGVFEIKDPTGNQLFRRMENPSHTAISNEQLPHKEKNEGKKTLKQVAEKLKSIVQEFAKIETQDVSGPVEILKSFFSDPAGDGDDNLEQEDIDPNGKFIITPQPRKLLSPTPRKPIDEGVDPSIGDGEGDSGGANTKHGNGTSTTGTTSGDGDGDGTGGTGDNSIDKTKSPANDTVLANKKRVTKIDGDQIDFIYAPVTPGIMRFYLAESGADFSEQIKIINSSVGLAVDGYLEVQFKDSSAKKIQLTSERPIKGGIKIVVAGS